MSKDNGCVYQYSPQALAASFQSFRTTEREAYLKAPLPDVKVTTARSNNTSDGSFVVAAVQMTGGGLEQSSVQGFCQRAEAGIIQAVQNFQAQLILLPELWNGPYFCQSQEACLQSLAQPLDNNILLQRLAQLAKKYQVVLPISLFEESNNVLFNSIVVLESDGSLVQDGKIYRKSHIPDGTGYQEKFYFSPGDTRGGGVFETSLGKIGVAICWDQWFPELARILALQGCELLLYPTAIGTEPQDATIDSSEHWQRVMQGHAAANMIPVVAANRFGTEILLEDDDDDEKEKQRINFYGKSFITDQTGAIVAQAPDNTLNEVVQVISSTIHPARNKAERLAWGLFRDRRPDLYTPLASKDGAVNH